MIRRRTLGGTLARGLVAAATVVGGVLASGLSSVVPAGASTVGPTWVAVGQPLPTNADANASSNVEAMSCPAPGSCLALGTYQSGGSDKIVADSLTNGVWTATQVPNPPSDDGTDTEVDALSCPTVNWCVATGRYSAAGNFLPYASVLSGGTWTTTALQLPPPPISGNPFTHTVDLGLSCPVAGWCVTVGGYVDASSHGQGYIDTLSGGSWTSMVAPLPPGQASDPEAVLTALSCNAIGSCVAGGTYLSTINEAIFDTLVGQTWTPTVAPVPTDAAASPDSQVESVSCPPAAYSPKGPLAAGGAGCVAVGQYQNASGGQALAWAQQAQGSSTFAANEVAAPSGASPNPRAVLSDVSCPTAGWCEAVGSYETPAFTGGFPLAASFSGGAWTAEPAPGAASGDVAAFLQTVSCSWPGSCVAAGQEELSSAEISLTDTLVNGVWSGNDSVLPNGPIGSTASTPVKPACAAGVCLVGGEFRNQPGQDLGYLATHPSLTGYQEVASDGGLFSFNAPFNGSMGGKPLNAPIVGMAAEPDNGGYDEVASDGGIFAFNAPFQGSMGGKPLNKPMVGMAFDTQTGGYYEVASDGGIFAYNAPFDGSMGGQPLNAPIVGMAFDTQTGGYYEVASDGGIFAYNAPFQGSMGGKPLNKPIVGMAFDPQTGGYYEVASDGGIFAYGAPFQGSMGGKPLNKPVVGLAFDYATGGYYEAASDGGIFAFNTLFQGSMGGQPLNKPVVGLAFG